MIRKNLKFLLTIFIIVMMSLSILSSFVYATDVEKLSETTEAINVDGESNESTSNKENPEIHRGDLYLFDNKVVMDKLVDGNVFIIGQEVEITGQVNGNLFVCANKLTFNNCYVINSIFACANSVYYNGACKDLYVISSNDIEMTYASFVERDLKASSDLIKFKTAIGRNADLFFNNIVLEEKVVLEGEVGSNVPTIEEDGVTYIIQNPIVYGNLRYTSPSEVTIPEGVITETGSVTYTNSKSQNISTTSVLEILNNFLVCIVTVIAICILIKLFIPKLSEKFENEKLSIDKILKCFGIGLASIVAVAVLFVLLLITQIGTKLAFILVLLFVLLCLVATPILAIVITNLLKPMLKLDKKPLFYLVLCLVSIVLYGVTLIPFIGGIFSFLITPISIGLLINMAIPHRKLTDEEKAIIEEKRKLAIEEKEKRKQEKTEMKEAKKQAKLEAKSAKKENKN